MNMAEAPGIDQAYLAPTYPLIRDIFYPKVDEFLTDLNMPYAINESKHTIHIFGLGKIICRTMEKPGSIIGWEVADAVLDEFDVLTVPKALEVFRKIKARLRQKNPTGRKGQVYVTTTPEGFKATYQLFKKAPVPNSHLIQMSTYSNEKNLPPDYIQDLKVQYPEQLINAYLLGQFVNLTSGSVYYAYDRKRCNTFYVAKPREPLLIGMDFNVNKMAAIVHIRRDGIVYAVDEFIGFRDTPDMIQAIKENYPDHKVYVYPDASGGNNSTNATDSDLALLRKARFIVRAKPSNPLIKNRVASMNNAFEKGFYKVNSFRCPQYADSLEQQVYGPNGMPDKSNDLDHPVDAGGYYIHYTFPIRQRAADTAQVVGA